MPYKDSGHGGNYMVDLSVPDWRKGRFKKSTGVTSLSVAKTYESDVRELYREGAFDCLDAVADGVLSFAKLRELRPQGIRTIRDHLETLATERAASHHTIEGLIHVFRKDQREEVTAKTLRGYLTHIKRYAEWAQGRLQLTGQATIEHIQTQLIREWRDRIVASAMEVEAAKGTQGDALERKRGQKRATANRHLNSLGAFCTVLVERGILQSNPTSGTRFTNENPARESTYRYMTPKEHGKFRRTSLLHDAEHPEISGTPRPNTLFWDFLVTTGATTWTEGCWVRRRNVHLEEEHPHNMVRISLVGTKSMYRSRDVFVPRQLAERLEAHCVRHEIGLEGRVFPFSHDEYLHVFDAIIRNLVADGEVRMGRFQPYCLRHTFAVSAVKGDPENGKAGVEIQILRELMGHNNIETTMMYAKHRSDGKQFACRVAAEGLGLWAEEDAE